MPFKLVPQKVNRLTQNSPRLFPVQMTSPFLLLLHWKSLYTLNYYSFLYCTSPLEKVIQLDQLKFPSIARDTQPKYGMERHPGPFLPSLFSFLPCPHIGLNLLNIASSGFPFLPIPEPPISIHPNNIPEFWSPCDGTYGNYYHASSH